MPTLYNRLRADIVPVPRQIFITPAYRLCSVSQDTRSALAISSAEHCAKHKSFNNLRSIHLRLGAITYRLNVAEVSFTAFAD